MKRAGIICEFNPFHNGHKRLFDAVRAAGAGEIVCVMSDYFVQRCEPAILPASFRAESAVACGADAVFALPFPYSCASAYFFAGAGTDILSRLGCDTLAFGSESGDLDFLCAEAARPEREITASEGSAGRFERLSPNDILGVEYIRAIQRNKLDLDLFTVKREGSSYKSEDVSELPSSTALRLALREGMPLGGIPEKSSETTEFAVSSGLAPSDIGAVGDALLAFWRICDAETVSCFAECGGGVAGRLQSCALKATSYGDMMRLSSTKKYTDARLRRAALFGFLGIMEEQLKASPAYVRLIAASETGRKMLKASDGNTGIDVVRRVSEIPDNDAADEQKKAELSSEALYCMTLPERLPAGTLFRKSAFIC